MEKTHSILLQKINEQRDPTLGSACRITNRTRIVSIIKEVQVILLPGYYNYEHLSTEDALERLAKDLKLEIDSTLCFAGRNMNTSQELTDAFLDTLPEVMRRLNTDIQAIYDGDPAAKSKAEVILCYPGFYAISIYRIAHELYRLGVPNIPRIMTEYAHEKTGIDINAGAIIGDYFCIDHGTGIVIGETAVLGDHVKLYQGVTLGAKSFEKDEQGHPVKGGKRHPNLGNHVTVYANATILGGDTVIGDNSVIGGNVWLLESVPAGSTIYYAKKTE
ncbi:MAG: serine O-acetyltransferase [Solobacterium sp.]|jgi:serine O-acetyltransferase|nr:serine O-acetyltransferase [Solobacterium sp.]MCH4205751.1 serine O-acetyltransferase [Solobacterium sp.]MCH4227275.1 serine O-acetyltransferase [Solobacterium sp.]